MNSEVFSRLESLMKSLALSVEKGSYTRAEMMAYAAGIELAAENLEEVLKNLFVDTASTSGLAMFLSLIGEKPNASENSLRNMIRNAISSGVMWFSKTEFNGFLSSMGFTYSVSGNEIRLSMKSALTRKTLENIRKVVNDYVPCSSVLTLAGNGRSFAEWDTLALRWFELDALNMPFYIAERL